MTLDVGHASIHPVKHVRNLGVLLDDELTMKKHINKVVSACFFQLRRLRQIRRLVGEDVTSQLVSSFVISRLDYCNSVLYGLPRSALEPLQRVLNAAARLICSLSPRDHVTTALQRLHWLPIEYRIKYKLCLLMHLIHIGRAPSYLSDIVHKVSSLGRHYTLRSADTLLYVKPRTRTKFGERAFQFAGPDVWNSLPVNLQQVTDTNSFKKLLKTVMFARAYECV